jgi:hypothetical protein
VDRLPEQGTLPRKVFKTTVGPTVASALESIASRTPGDERGDLPAAIRGLKRRIGDLNRPAFATRLEWFLAHLRVPIDDIRPMVAKLSGVRHAIVHTGTYPPTVGKDFSVPPMLVMRELVARCFLALLDFHGQYETYLHGPASAEFVRAPATANSGVSSPRASRLTVLGWLSLLFRRLLHREGSSRP